MGASFRHMAETGKEALGGVVKRSVRSCVLLLAVTLLCGLTEGVKAGTGGSGLGGDHTGGHPVHHRHRGGGCQLPAVHGGEAIFNMETLGDVLLPTVSMATAASGTPAMAVVKHGATILFSDFLIRLIDTLLIPLCYAFVAANVAWAALGNDGSSGSAAC